MNTAAARKAVTDQLVTIGVHVTARLLAVKGGRVRTMYLGATLDARADEIAKLLGGTVSGYPGSRRVEL